jgi:hypothetical protein
VDWFGRWNQATAFLAMSLATALAFAVLVGLVPRIAFPLLDTSQPLSCPGTCAVPAAPEIPTDTAVVTNPDPNEPDAASVLQLQLSGLDPSRHTVAAFLTATFTDSAWRTARYSAGGPNVKGTVVNPTDANTSVVVTVTTIGPDVKNTTRSAQISSSLSFSLSEMSARAAKQIVLPLMGNPGSYPQDKYQVSVTLSAASSRVTLPKKLDLFFQADNSNSGFATAYPPPPDGAQVTFAYQRHTATVFFADVLTYLVPGIVIFYLLIVLYGPRASRSTLREFLAALAVFSVSLLLLRTVLVPQSITVLTRVDYSLMASVVLMLLVPLPMVLAPSVEMLARWMKQQAKRTEKNPRG